MCTGTSCQEAKLQSGISTLYEEHMLQHSPLPNRFCSGSRNPRRWLWLALATGSGLNISHISPSSITLWFLITAGRWHCWRKVEYNSFPNAVCIHWWVFFAPGTSAVTVVIGICCGMRIVGSASCCYFAPTQTVMEISVLVISVNQPRNAGKILPWDCNPCRPRAPLLWPEPWHRTGRVLHIPRSRQRWGLAVFSTAAFYLLCAVVDQGHGQTNVLSLVRCL